MPIAPIMIYGDDVSHVVTEEGIAYLYKAEGQEERRRALAAVAGVSPVGMKAIPSETAALRKKGVVAYPEDIGVQRLEAKRSLLAARSMRRSGRLVRRDSTTRRHVFGAGNDDRIFVDVLGSSNALATPVWLASLALTSIDRRGGVDAETRLGRPSRLRRSRRSIARIMRRSALAIEPYFYEMASSPGTPPSQSLREQLARTGRARGARDADGYRRKQLPQGRDLDTGAV